MKTRMTILMAGLIAIAITAAYSTTTLAVPTAVPAAYSHVSAPGDPGAAARQSGTFMLAKGGGHGAGRGGGHGARGHGSRGYGSGVSGYISGYGVNGFYGTTYSDDPNVSDYFRGDSFFGSDTGTTYSPY
jgi:hypothetical protein